MLFFGPLEKCPVCGYQLNCTGSNYACKGSYSEWTTCTHTTRESPRKKQPIKVPDEIKDPMVLDVGLPHLYLNSSAFVVGSWNYFV